MFSPIRDSVYKNTVFSLRYVCPDSFVIATPNYLPGHLFEYSGGGDTIIYGFRKNNTGSYYKSFINAYSVNLNLVKDSVYVNLHESIDCFDYVDMYFAGKRSN
jgi:hypothetical protein